VKPHVRHTPSIVVEEPPKEKEPAREQPSRDSLDGENDQMDKQIHHSPIQRNILFVQVVAMKQTPKTAQIAPTQPRKATTHLPSSKTAIMTTQTQTTTQTTSATTATAQVNITNAFQKALK
jgi:hypothetical protein